MSKLKVLIVHDSSSAAFIFQRYLPVEINAIYFSEHEVISPVRNPLFFVKNGFSSQVNQIKDLSNEYDVFLCFGWIATAICYLAGVNYVMYFVDSYIDPEYRIRRNTSVLKKCFLSELYKDTLQYASKTVAALLHDAEILQKYRSDTKIIFQMVDPEMFNPNVEKIVEDKNFREELAKNQNEWVRNTFNNKKTSLQWQEVFEEVTKDSHMPKKRYLISLKLINILEKITKKDFSTVGRGLNHS